MAMRRLSRLLGRKNRRHTGPRIALGLKAARERLTAFLLAAVRRVAHALPYALIAAIAASLPVLAVYGYRYVTRAPDFAVREVRVEGHGRVELSELLSAAGLDDAPNLLVLDLEAVEAALEAHPWIVTARVARELPDRLVVQVTEREPAARIALGATYLVDSRGDIFTRVAANETWDLPLLTGLRWDDLSQDATPDRVALAKRLIRGAISLAAAWTRSPFGERVPLAEVHLDPLFGYAVVLRGGPKAMEGSRVHLGRGNVPAKIEKLGALLADAERRGREIAEVRLDDERDPNRVAVRFRALPEPEPAPAHETGKKQRGRDGSGARRKHGKG